MADHGLSFPLRGMTVINHSSSDLIELLISDVDAVQDREGPERALLTPTIRTISRKHGTKFVPVRGRPRSRHWRITAYLGRDRLPVSATFSGRSGTAYKHPDGGREHFSGPNLNLRAINEWSFLTIFDPTNPSAWMSGLPDNTLLSDMTIPGTHDTCARDHGGDMYICQTLTLREQLDAGIRFVDIRCRHYQNAFPIHHDKIFEHLYFSPDVQEVCLRFLSDHPSECIIMSVKNEYTDSGNSRSFHSTFDAYVNPHRNRWFLEDRLPTLGEVRGKIVLLRRFTADTLPRGINADPTNWGDDRTFTINGNVTLRVQDNYIVWTVCNIDDKWDKVRSVLDEATASAPDQLFINYCSGWGAGAYPNAIAMGTPGIKGVNEFLRDYLLENPVGRLGIIGLDFPEYPNTELIAELYARNIA